MRTVFSNSMCAHVWAQQSQSFGRSHNGNLFFEHETLYSYTDGFPVGRFVTNARGERAVLLNSRSYSITTSQHQTLAVCAVVGLGLPIFHVPNCGYDRGGGLDHAAVLHSFEERAVEAFNSADRARKYRDRYLSAANSDLEQAGAYAAFFDLQWEWAGADLARAKWEEEARLAAERLARERKEAARAWAAEQAALKDRDREDFERWQAGLRPYCPYTWQTDEAGSAYLRINCDRLETSQGAEVPLEDAKRAFRLIKRCHDRSEGWRPNGQSVRVGKFTVDQITPEGNIRAGCHYITWPHIERAAIEAAVFDDRSHEPEATAHA